MNEALIILFHGSRAERSGDAVQRLVDAIQQRGKFKAVEKAYLQHSAPGLKEAVRRCHLKKAARIIVVPLFFQTGTHVTSDIPAIIDEIRGSYDVVIEVTAAVGSHPMIADIVLDLAGKTEHQDNHRKAD